MQFDRKRLPVSTEELNTRQTAFVEEYIRLGGKKGCEVEAALHAGYGAGIRDKAAAQGRKLLRNPYVAAAIKAELRNAFAASAVLGLEVIKDLAQKGTDATRFQAAKYLVDQGFGPIVSRNAHIHAEVTTIEDLITIAEEDEAREQDEAAIDAEFVEAAPTAQSKGD